MLLTSGLCLVMYVLKLRRSPAIALVASAAMILALFLSLGAGLRDAGATSGVEPPVAQDDTEDSGDDDGSVTLTLLHNNDGESKLLADTEGGFPGIARFAQTWQDLGTETDADILLRVTSGDNFLASKELAVSLALPDDQAMYDSVALSGLYEVIGLGNHDFDFGPDVAARFISGFSPEVPFVGANLNFAGEPSLTALIDEGRLAGSTVITDSTSNESVGVIGLVTPRLANISSPRNIEVNADLAGVVNREVAELEAQGINRIVLLSHLQGLGEDRALVPQISGVDIVVAGGGDELLKNDGDSCLADEPAIDAYPLLLADAAGSQVPVVTAPGGYRCIGKLDVTFDADGQITDWSGSSIGVALDGAQESYALESVETPLAAALEGLTGTIVANSDVELNGAKADIRTGATNLGELMADAILDAGRTADQFGGVPAQVGLQNGGGIRNDSVIPAGALSQATTFDIAPFPNFVVSLEVDRATFKQMLEVGVGGLPGAEGTFPQISGFSMAIDPDRPGLAPTSDGACPEGDGERVRSVVLADGTEIVSDGQVIDGPPIQLATIDFLAGGGDCYPLDGIETTNVGVSYQAALANFLAGPLGGTVSGNDYPVGGTRIVVGEVAPGATAPEAADDGDDDDAGEDDDAGGATDDAGDESAASQTPTPATLPDTGVESWIYGVFGLTVALGGALVINESRRTSELSLLNRLFATRAWMPGRTDND